SVAGYDYSDAMKSSGLTWNQGNLDRFLTDPKGVVPGTKMTFPGLKDAGKRKAVIDYLKTL
ncbi:MAG: cytochrome c family protein, partial [Acetobacteraceae bacterium]|nr:cytochrome c family protein [Acetobacteraceae bacterium]